MIELPVEMATRRGLSILDAAMPGTLALEALARRSRRIAGPASGPRSPMSLN